MKKFLALLLTLVMALSLAACGGNSGSGDTQTQDPAGTTEPAEPTVYEDADEVEDNMTSADGKYQVAFVTDVGQLKDGSFNEGCWNGVKLYAANNGLSYKYYQPANGSAATDDDRYDAMKAAASAGADVVICAGFLQATALQKAAEELTDTKFIFIDGWQLGLENVAAVVFNEHECGYFAGYACVKDGFTKLGFCGGGGGTNPACERYGYGFAQGANAAAAEMGINVEMNYTWQYGSTYSPSAELQAMASGWYENGTEVIFSCGGDMFDSIAAAASANDGYVVGVDCDQAGDSDTVITSAMKGVDQAVMFCTAKFYDGQWADVADQLISLGAADGATGIPTADSSWRFENFTVAEYEEIFNGVIAGTIKVDGSDLANDEIKNVEFSNLTVSYT